MIILDEYDEEELFNDILLHYQIKCRIEGEHEAFEHYNHYVKTYLQHLHHHFLIAIENKETPC